MLIGVQFIVVLINFIFKQPISHSTSESSPLVSILIPARNEEKNIENILQDLKSQSYSSIEIIVCNDQSEDATAILVEKMMIEDSRIRLIESSPLASGWLGKNWACHQLSKVAKGDYFLFLDADVRVKDPLIAQSVHYFQKHGLGLLSIFPKQLMKTFGEYCTVPLMHYILTTLLPLILVRVSKFPSLSAANGQFMLFDSAVYQQYQPHLMMKGEKVEDITIARNFKRRGIKVACITGIQEITCRMYESYQEGISGFSKNMVAFFGNSYLLAFTFWALTTLSIIYVPIYGNSILTIAFFSLYLGAKILFSLTSKQNILINILLTIPQHITMLVILTQSLIHKYTKKQQWKGRSI
jgi:glycosyltransferase involved in cell wall biosynthesis